jgi:hypothetical protein
MEVKGCVKGGERKSSQVWQCCSGFVMSAVCFSVLDYSAVVCFLWILCQSTDDDNADDHVLYLLSIKENVECVEGIFSFFFSSFNI